MNQAPFCRAKIACSVVPSGATRHQTSEINATPRGLLFEICSRVTSHFGYCCASLSITASSSISEYDLYPNSRHLRHKVVRDTIKTSACVFKISNSCTSLIKEVDILLVTKTTIQDYDSNLSDKSPVTIA